MADAFTMFWTHQRCASLRRLGWSGRPVEVLFGGPHISEPSFTRAGVHPADSLYFISVFSGVVYVLGRARVRQMLTLEEYVHLQAGLFAPFIQDPPSWVFEHGYPGMTPSSVQATQAFDQYRAAYPEIQALAPTCTEEAVLCESSTPLSFNAAITPEQLECLRFRSQRRERDLQKYLRDGRLIQALPIQGIYRLTESSARELDTLVESRTSLCASSVH